MAITHSILVLILLVAASYLSAQAFGKIYAMIGKGQPEDLKDNWMARAYSVYEMVFLGKKLLDDRAYGWMHFVYMYGFLILGIGHMELLFFGLTRFFENLSSTDSHGLLYRHFLPTFLTQIYEFTQDCMAFLVVFVVSIALYKRLSGTKKRLLPRSKDAELILWFIGALYFTFFIYIGSETYARMMLGEISASWHWYLPFSSIIALMMSGVSELTTAITNQIGYWLHLGIFLGFACYIPRSKHLHLVMAGPNIYFRHLDGVAKPKIIDFETAEEFGVDKIENFSWKTLLDTFACSECSRCNDVCPAKASHKPLQPKKVLHNIKMNLRNQELDGKKENLIARDKVENNIYPDTQIHLEEIWACTTCAACVEVCPILIDSVPTSLIDIRRHLVLMEANDYPKELNAAFKGMENQQNPWGVGRDQRIEWTSKLDFDIPILKDLVEKDPEGQVEYLFWVGCAGSTDDRAKKIQQSLVRILKKSGVDFAILGCEEKCTGDPARRMGNEYLFDMLAKDNIETLNKYKGKFKKIFATCPHCFNSLKNEYKDLGIELEVYHHTELLNELLKDKRIKLKDKLDIQKEKITFHDPCYLGRYNNEYDSPRNILKELGDIEQVEMKLNKRKSSCCGAGGGRMFMEEDIGERINHQRTDQALETGATTIATGCPFCMTMLNDGVKDKGKDDIVQVKDIAEIVEERMA